MSKCLECYKTYKWMIMGMTIQGVILITMRNVRVLEAKKLAYELSGLFDKVAGPQADNDSSNSSATFSQKLFSY